MSESMMILMIPLMEQTKHDNNDDGRWLLVVVYEIRMDGWTWTSTLKSCDRHNKIMHRVQMYNCTSITTDNIMK
jgi:hypothetical protein